MIKMTDKEVTQFWANVCLKQAIEGDIPLEDLCSHILMYCDYIDIEYLETAKNNVVKTVTCGFFKGVKLVKPCSYYLITEYFELVGIREGVSYSQQWEEFKELIQGTRCKRILPFIKGYFNEQYIEECLSMDLEAINEKT